MEYFAQDEATRLDPTLTVYETLQAGSPNDMVPAIRNILGGFLFSGDDVYKKAGVLSGGERTRLAVARMLLRPVEHAAARRADQPPRPRLEGRAARRARGLRRHADHRLARPLLRREAGDEDHRDRPRRGGRLSRHLRGVPVAQGASRGSGLRPPGSGIRSRPKAQGSSAQGPRLQRPGPRKPAKPQQTPSPEPEARSPQTREARKRDDAERKKKQRASESLQKRIADLEARIAERESQVKELEAAMSAPGFYDDRDASKAAADRHQALMWEVGDLMAPVGSAAGTRRRAASES